MMLSASETYSWRQPCGQKQKGIADHMIMVCGNAWGIYIDTSKPLTAELLNVCTETEDNGAPLKMAI